MKSSAPNQAPDSKIMRSRIGAKVSLIASEHDLDGLLSSKLKTEGGLTVLGVFASDFEEFFESITLPQCLNSIKIIYEATVELTKGNRPRRNPIGDDFKVFVNKVFKDEKLPYVMEENGKVIYTPDPEFEDNRTRTINHLSESRFNAAFTAFNLAFDDFQADPPRLKSALRNIFEANEIVFKQITKAKNLTAFSINHHKSKFLTLTIDKTSNDAQEHIIESYKSWVTAFHEYRHGQDVEKYDEPTLDFTTLGLSTGAAFLRWIVLIAKAINKA